MGLEGLLEGLGAELPPRVRQVLAAAAEHGWELNKPGMTIALRLNHPTLADAYPVYITWAVSRTPRGALSFRFVSCGTKSLVPLTGTELLEYLAEPALVLPLPGSDSGECGMHLCGASDVSIWATGETYCARHAKVMLSAEAFNQGPGEVREWDSGVMPLNGSQKAVGATGTGNPYNHPSPAKKPPLRVTAPPATKQANLQLF